MALLMSNQPMHGCGAGCEFSASYYRAVNQWSPDPSLGAQVFFFGARGSESHTGVVVGYDATHVFTVEGNTGYSVGYSGGAVLERTYSRGDSRIAGYGVYAQLSQQLNEAVREVSIRPGRAPWSSVSRI